MIWNIVLLAVGFYLLLMAANALVDGSAGAAKLLGIPKIIVGLTLVAFGTSAPEGTVSLISAIQGNSDISIGNIVGSNIANIALVLGLAALMNPLQVTKATVNSGIPLNILATFVLLVLGYDVFFQNHQVEFNRLTLGDGLIFLCFFIVYLYYIHADLKETKVQEEVISKRERKEAREPWWKLLFMVAIGLIGIIAGGKLVVDNAVGIAANLGVSDAIIGLTIIAIGTSLPELATSLVAAYKRENDLAIGNIIGSNVFNIFLVLGVTSTASTINFNEHLVPDMLVMLVVVLLLFLFVYRERVLKKWHGMVLLFSYCAYLFFLVSREMYF
jgi:cation:H+ antiporter